MTNNQFAAVLVKKYLGYKHTNDEEKYITNLTSTI